jgi:AcrR family transcriptional regulator
MKKKPEVTTHTKQNLIDAFWSLYCIKHIERITVREIAERAGYNRGTFYEYFTDTYNVLEQIEDSLLPGEQELPPKSLDAQAATAQPINAFIKMYEQNRKYYIVLFGNNGDPAFVGKIKDRIKPMIRQMLVKKSCADEFELDYTLEFMLSAMIGILSYWFLQQDSPPSDRLLSLMYDLIEKGVMHRLK